MKNQLKRKQNSTQLCRGPFNFEGCPHGCFLNLQGGTQQISLSIAEELGDSRLRLSEPVTSITQEEHLVTVTTNNGSVFKCKKVVLAIPPNQFGKDELQLIYANNS